MSRPDLAPLLRWYRAEARSLPWREDPSPYKVLLSELMCQQTRVETALPYFERFLERWPTLEDLAAASEQEVLEEWAGLGYYSRARNLLKCAIEAVARGGLPEDAAQLATLPGIGAYTAGAISSIAFGRPEAAVDGNVQRVLARVFLVEQPTATGPGNRAIWRHARALHEGLEAPPGDLNQAIMELGARVCTPRKPRCSTCPLSASCEAFTRGRQAELPVPRVRKPPVPIRGVAGVLRGPAGTFVVRRPGSGLLGGLWGPPMVLEPPGEPSDALVEAFGSVGIPIRLERELGEVVHVFSHRRLTATVFEVRLAAPLAADVERDDTRWSPSPKGLSSLARKILALRPSSQMSLMDPGSIRA